MGKESANKPKKGYSTDLDDICRTIEHLHSNLRVKILSNGTDKAFHDEEIDKLKEVQNKINDYMKEVIESENSEKAQANSNSVLWKKELKEVQNKINDYMKEVIESENSEKAQANSNSVLWCNLCSIFSSQKRPKQHTLRKNTWQSTNSPTGDVTLSLLIK